MAAAMEQKANDLKQQAEKRLASSSWMPGSGTQKYEDSEELFVKAGNAYKMAKNWKEAGDMFKKAAECALKLKEKHNASTHFIEAGNAYKKDSADDAVAAYRMAIELHVDQGRFTMAGKYQKTIAELYEGEGDLEQAIENYQAAADYMMGEDQTAGANQCLLKVAQFSAINEKYSKAIEIYEQVAASSLENPLLKFSVKDYYFRAGLCRLCTEDQVGTKRALDKYRSMDPSFEQTRECKLLLTVLDAVEKYDVEMFTQAVFEFDQVTKLDSWKTTMLLRVKNSVKLGSSENPDESLA